MRTRPHDCEDRRPRPGALAKGGAAQHPDRIGCSAKQTKILLQHNDVHRDVVKGRSFSFLPLGQGGHAMTDLDYRLDRFETLAAECELIAKAATDGAKRELYLRLGLHYRELVADMRTAIATKAAA